MAAAAAACRLPAVSPWLTATPFPPPTCPQASKGAKQQGTGLLQQDGEVLHRRTELVGAAVVSAAP